MIKASLLRKVNAPVGAALTNGVLRVLAAWSCVTFVTLGAAPVSASEWYRYQDENGVVVMAQSVPPNFAHKGYAVVNDDGRVLRVVPRQLTPEEIVVRDRELARQAAIEAERQAALDHDKKLMELYATPEEVEFARDARLKSIEQKINTLKSDIQRLEGNLRVYQTQAAERERGQMPVSKDLLQNMETVQFQISEKQEEIEKRREEQDKVRDDFARDLDRIYELYGLQRPTPSEAQAEKMPVASSGH